MTNLLKQVLVGILLLAAVLGSSWSLMSPELFRVHDYIHAARVVELVRSASDGHWPVQWSANFGYGYGMPLFLYYAPLPYYVAGFWFWITQDMIGSVKLLFLIANLGSTLGGYLLGKRLSGSRLIGVVVALAFGLAPYRALNLFVRGAVSEAWGMMGLVWLWYGLVGVLQTRVRSLKWRSFFSSDWWVVVAGSSMVLLTHNLTTLMVFPLTAVWGLSWLIFASFQAWRGWGKEIGQTALTIRWRLGQSISGVVAALGLSSFYLLPAFFEKHMVALDSILSGYFDYTQHFLYIRQFFDSEWGFGGSSWGPEDDISFFLGYPIFIFGGALVLLALSAVFRKTAFKKLSIKNWHFWWVSFGLVTALSLFLTLMRSAPLWDGISLFEYIQFPWRFLSIASLGLSLVVGLGLLFFKGRFRVVLACLVIVASLFQSSYFRPEFWLEDSESLYYQDKSKIRANMSDILPDYLPAGLVIGGENGLKPHLADQPLVKEAQRANSQLLIDHAHQKLMTISLEEPAEVILAIADFPHWRVEVDGARVDHYVTEQGLVALELAEGTWQIGAYLEATPLRKIANLISLLTLVALSSIMVVSRTREDLRDD